MKLTGRNAPLAMLQFALLALLAPAVAEPAWSARSPLSNRARDYVVTRKAHRVSALSPSLALKTTGHGGKIVEWAGVVDGLATREDGLYIVLRTHGGDLIPIRAQNAGTWALKKPVYVLGQVKEGPEGLQYVDAVAMALSNEVSALHVANLKRATPSLAQQSLPFMQIDSRSLSQATSMSLDGAVRWILSFNRSLDRGRAEDMAKAVLYFCARHGVDARMMLALFAAESAFNERAVSSAGAQGLGQLMPGTAQVLGVKNSFDRYQNMEGSIRHVAGLLARWRGSPTAWQLTLASYNAGAGAVEQYRGIPPYPETIQYVRTIFGYYSQLSRMQ